MFVSIPYGLPLLKHIHALGVIFFGQASRVQINIIVRLGMSLSLDDTFVVFTLDSLIPCLPQARAIVLCTHYISWHLHCWRMEQMFEPRGVERTERTERTDRVTFRQKQKQKKYRPTPYCESVQYVP